MKKPPNFIKQFNSFDMISIRLDFLFFYNIRILIITSANVTIAKKTIPALYSAVMKNIKNATIKINGNIIKPIISLTKISKPFLFIPNVWSFKKIIFIIIDHMLF